MSEETADELIDFEKPSLVSTILEKFPINEKLQVKGQLTALLHFFVISVMLAALNWLFAKSDPGWLELNPSPWVILPFYLGFRFGFFWGVGSGFLLVIVRIWLEGLQVAEGETINFTGSEHFLLWGAVLMGAIGGFTRGVIGRRETQKEILLEDSLTLNRNLKNQVALLKHNEQDISAVLVSQGLEPSGLVLSLHDVIDQYAAADRDEAFLNLLRDRCGVNSAAIYFSARNGRGVRVAQLRSDNAFPESIDQTPMFEHAERTGKIVTQRWFWEPFEPNASGGYDDFFLAVVAHPKDKDFRVLVISRMDFEQIHWENFWKIESAFRWFENSMNSKTPLEFQIEQPKSQSPIEETREEIIKEESPEAPIENELSDGSVDTAAAIPPAPKKEILDPPAFKKRLAQCRLIEEQMGLEHRLVIFVPGETESAERCEAFAQSLSAIMPEADDLALIPSDGGRFVYGLITAASSSEIAEAHAGELLSKLPDLDLRFFVLHLNDHALSAFEN
ncbi:MAG: hypothetical protein P1V20_22300 [Verrucomicrobiales bacterium]|nr:hypothetical protein [Verrucomicrobiales bacterium]